MLAALVVSVGAQAAAPPQLRIAEFPIATLGAGGTTAPIGIAAGPDGNMWFTESTSVMVERTGPRGKTTEWYGNAIGRITSAGKVTSFPVPTADSAPWGIAAGPDGNLWFTEWRGDKIGRITRSGKITEFPLPGSGPVETVIDAGPGIAAGPDGNLWLAGETGNIGRVTTNGQVTVFPTPSARSGGNRFTPEAIAAGPDGNLWFTEAQYGGAGKIGRITPGGEISEFSIPSPVSKPIGVAAGPDGNLWFTEADAIGRITPSGRISEFPIPTAKSGPWGIAAGPDGNVWFVENQGNEIGRIGVGASAPLISLTAVRLGNGDASVSWRRTAAATSSPITSYVVTAVPWGTDRRAPNGLLVRRATRARGVAAASATSGTVGGLVGDCHQVYELTVTPMMGRTAGPVAKWPYPVRPSGIVSPTEPDRVVILLDGIRESKPAEVFDPYKPTLHGMPSYCPEAWRPRSRAWAEADFVGSPHGPWEFFNKWNFHDLGGDAAKTGNSTPRVLNRTQAVETHEFMLDAVAAQGSVILPYSYDGATLSKQPGRDPVFRFSPYTGCDSDPSCRVDREIGDDVQTLNQEIASIHSVWPESELIIVGHSQGGLIAFKWWLQYGYQAARGSAGARVGAVFTLDSPVNGACAVTVVCAGPPSYPGYGDRVDDDKKALAKDRAAGWPVHFIGTSGDTVPIGPLRAYGSRGKENLQHDLMVTGDRCSDQRHNADCPSPPDHVSGCPIEDGSPSWMKDDEHFIVKFCPDDVAYFDDALGLKY